MSAHDGNAITIKFCCHSITFNFWSSHSHRNFHSIYRELEKILFYQESELEIKLVLKHSLLLIGCYICFKCRPINWYYLLSLISVISSQTVWIHCKDVIMSAVASQITGVSIVYWTADESSKHQSSASLAFVRGIDQLPVDAPHKGPVTRKIFPFDDVIMSIWKRRVNWWWLIKLVLYYAKLCFPIDPMTFTCIPW